MFKKRKRTYHADNKLDDNSALKVFRQISLRRHHIRTQPSRQLEQKEKRHSQRIEISSIVI